jgi:hypothetical protein
MDTNILVIRLGIVFDALQNNCVAIECAAIAPAYPDLVSSLYREERMKLAGQYA